MHAIELNNNKMNYLNIRSEKLTKLNEAII